MTQAFEKPVWMLDYPMFVVTARAGEQSAGCLVGFPITPTGRTNSPAAHVVTFSDVRDLDPGHEA